MFIRSKWHECPDNLDSSRDADHYIEQSIDDIHDLALKVMDDLEEHGFDYDEYHVLMCNQILECFKEELKNYIDREHQ